MGFLKLGQRSLKQFTKGGARRNKSTSQAGQEMDGESDGETSRDSGSIANENVMHPEPFDKETSIVSFLSSQSDVPVESNMRTPPASEPMPPRQLTPFECLPVEILQRIFLLSLNPDLPAASYHLLGILSSPYLFTHFFATAILDDSLSRVEYKRVMSYLLSKPSIDAAFLLRTEDMLWNRKFEELFSTSFPTGSTIATDTTSTSHGIRPHYNKWWDMQYTTPEESDKVHRRYLQGLEQRMVNGKLDLRTVSFPKKRLYPPYSVSQFQFLKEVVYRMPFCYAEVANGEAGRRWCDRAMEMAVRSRSASMVFFLMTSFFVTPSEHHARLALLPRDYGYYERLRPEYKDDYCMTQEEDMAAMDLIKSMGTGSMGANIPESALFVNRMKRWKDETGDITKAGWPPYTQEMADSLRVLFVLCYMQTGYAAKLLQGFPMALKQSDLVKDEQVWRGALQEKGPLLEWLMIVGSPPAAVVQQGLI